MAVEQGQIKQAQGVHAGIQPRHTLAGPPESRSARTCSPRARYSSSRWSVVALSRAVPASSCNRCAARPAIAHAQHSFGASVKAQQPATCN